MKQSDSFHIYDRRVDYSVTNIRDILFDVVGRKDDTVEKEVVKLRTTRSQLSIIGKGGCGVRHFVTVNLALAYANMMMNSLTYMVAIPTMLNHTAIKIHINNSDPDYNSEYFDRPRIGSYHSDCPPIQDTQPPFADGPFDWPDSFISISLIAPQFGFIAASLPAAILAKRCGAKRVMGAGLLIQSLFQMMIPAAAQSGFTHFLLLLTVQNIAQAPSLPCTYMLLSNWIPPCERSRMVAVVGSVLPIGSMIVRYLGLTLCQCELCGGWAAHFYFFSACSVLLSMFFIFFMWEDPEICPVISNAEKDYIETELSRYKRFVPAQIPWMKVAKSGPCWALWIANIGETIYITTVIIVVPLYKVQVLNNDRKYDFLEFLLPGLLMVTSGIIGAVVADCLIIRGKMKTFTARKFFNSLALFGTAIGMSVISHTGCDLGAALAIYNITALLNGFISSGFRVNYLEVSHNFSGIVVSIGKTLAVISSIIWSSIVGFLTLIGEKTLRKWQLVFFIAAIILASTATVFICLGSSHRQNWDHTNRFSGAKGRFSVTFTKEVDGGNSSNEKSVSK